MLDATADALAKHILGILPPNAAHSSSQLDELPISIAHYLKGVLRRRVRREAALPKSDWFNEQAEDVEFARKRWLEAVDSAAHFPAESWPNAARTAARQVLAYLVEPVETAAAFSFTDNTSSTSIDLIKERLESFTAYPYLREIANGYLDKKHIDSIDRAEFEKLLRQIDVRMVREYDASSWMALLEPLFDLVSEIPNQQGVSTDLLKRFFEAKSKEGIAEALEGDAYTADELRKTLQSIAEDSSSNIEDAKITEEEVETRTGEKNSDPDESGSKEAPTQGEPLWKTLKEPGKADDPQAETEKEPAPTADKSRDEPEPLWKKLSGASASNTEQEALASDEQADTTDEQKRPNPEPLSQLETRILGSSATERRDWYISNVTGGSEHTYREVLESIDKAPSWEKAWPILKDTYQQHQVQIYSDAVIAFTDAIETHFAE